MKISLAFFALACLFSGCVGYQYVASPAYVPLHSSKGEVKANFTGRSVQASYSVSSRMYIAGSSFIRDVSYFSFGGTDKENSGRKESSSDFHEHTFGVGYYSSKKFSTDIFAGGGFGSLKYKKNTDYLDEYLFSLDGNSYKIFLQAAGGWKRKSVEFAGFSRFCYWRLHDIQSKLDLGSASEPEENDRDFYERSNISFFFVEPGLSFKAGRKRFKFVTTISNTINVSKFDLHYRHFNFYLGCSLSFDVLKKNGGQSNQ